jgi:hypothetical protein
MRLSGSVLAQLDHGLQAVIGHENAKAIVDVTATQNGENQQ